MQLSKSNKKMYRTFCQVTFLHIVSFGPELRPLLPGLSGGNTKAVSFLPNVWSLWCVWHKLDCSFYTLRVERKRWTMSGGCHLLDLLNWHVAHTGRLMAWHAGDIYQLRPLFGIKVQCRDLHWNHLFLWLWSYLLYLGQCSLTMGFLGREKQTRKEVFTQTAEGIPLKDSEHFSSDSFLIVLPGFYEGFHILFHFLGHLDHIKQNRWASTPVIVKFDIEPGRSIAFYNESNNDLEGLTGVHCSCVKDQNPCCCCQPSCHVQGTWLPLHKIFVNYARANAKPVLQEQPLVVREILKLFRIRSAVFVRNWLKLNRILSVQVRLCVQLLANWPTQLGGRRSWTIKISDDVTQRQLVNMEKASKKM